jgi:hypothetical protein
MVFSASQNEQILTTDKTLLKRKYLAMKEQEKETGQNIYLLSQIFHEKVIVIMN